MTRNASSTSKETVSVIIASLCCAAALFGRAATGSGLQNLEVSSDLSPIEPYAISLDRAFSTAAHSYATTVDSTSASFIYVTAKAFSFDDAITVNGQVAYSGIPFKAKLALGESRFEVAVSQAKGRKTVYTLQLTRKDLSKEYRSEFIQKGVWRIEDYEAPQRGH